jgi:hypothetical protein
MIAKADADFRKTSWSPLSTGVPLLTRRKNLVGCAINLFAPEIRAKGRYKHPIWYYKILGAPYVAVNEIEHAASRRFGRDSFQTRSTP